MTVAFVFPGQGSQSVGMQEALAGEFAAVGETYSEASEALGFDLWDLVRNGPAESLNETVNTQPAMLTAGVATWRAWQAAGGPVPAMMAGHSLGEYAALVSAGALAFPDTVALVRRRAELMQGAVPSGDGAMAAILGLDDDVIIEVCAAASAAGIAEAANFNSPGQVVVAGDSAGIARVIELAKEAGARRAMPLAVSVPAHSSLMRPAGEALAALIDAAEFSEPEVTVVSAVDGTPYANAADMKERMKTQVYSPVRWVNVIGCMTNNGVDRIYECGPGKVLAGLMRRIDRNVDAACIDGPDSLQTAIDGASA